MLILIGQLVFSRRFYIAIFALILVSGCSVAKMATPVKAKDISAVKPNVTRQQIESHLGTPLREWKANQNIKFCLYEYYGGYAGDMRYAAAAAFLDVFSLGLFEIIGMNEDLTEGMHAANRIVISYDNSDVALGVFEEYAILPENGLSTDK